MCDSVRRHLAAMDAAEPQTALADRELVQRHVARVIVKPQALDVWLIPTCARHRLRPKTRVLMTRLPVTRR